MVRLTVTEGPWAGMAFELERLPAIMGRDPTCQVTLDDRRLSRQHTQIHQRDGELWVEDLGSSNGTFVNGVRLPEGRLRDGDELRCAKLRFHVMKVADNQPLAPVSVIQSGASMKEISLPDLLARHSTDGSVSSISEEPELRLEVLLRIGQLLSGPEPLDALLQQSLDLLHEILPVDRAVLLLHEADGGGLVPRARLFKPGLGGMHGFSSRIAEYVMRERVAARFADARSDERLSASESIMRDHVRASMCAPLWARGQVHGVLYVDNLANPALFTEHDLLMLDAFACQVGLAVDNAHLSRRLQEEALARRTLQQFFAPSTVERILAQGDLADDIVETEVTALFCDLSGFTQLSSERPPREVMELLSLFLPRMANIVFAYDGTLEKYIGDAVLAVWGVPFPHPDPVGAAVRAAVEMQQAMEGIQHAWHGDEDLAVHIGLNTGLAAAGPIGADFQQYVTVGDTTNVAARVCDHADRHEILMTEASRLQWVEPDRQLQSLGAVDLPGRKDPVVLHRVPWKRPGT